MRLRISAFEGLSLNSDPIELYAPKYPLHESSSNICILMQKIIIINFPPHSFFIHVLRFSASQWLIALALISVSFSYLLSDLLSRHASTWPTLIKLKEK